MMKILNVYHNIDGFTTTRVMPEETSESMESIER